MPSPEPEPDQVPAQRPEPGPDQVPAQGQAPALGHPPVPDQDALPPHPDLAPLLFLLGRWEGAGVGGYPTIESFQFGQEIVFSHNGKPFLIYASRSWLLDEEGHPGRPLATETGYWRPQPDGQVEVVLAHPTGITEIYLGAVTGTKIEMSTDVVARTSSAKEVTAGHRLYGMVGADLAWAYDMAAVGQPLQPHLSAQLKRPGQFSRNQ
jgi:hypothetical protein